jgi:hypothetical protein
VITRVHRHFKEALEAYVDFLLIFHETPRSKVAKKYLPPMDMLIEESSSMWDETIGANSDVKKHDDITSHKNSTKRAMTE